MHTLFAKTLGAVCFLSMLFVPVFAQQSQQPNIIVILADDMGFSDLGCTGSEIPTPNLDQLAEDGVLFTNFYSTPRCTPSRGSVLTGVTGHQSGVGHLNESWDYPSYQGRLTDNAVTIAEVLQPKGYRSILTGKWHLGDNEAYWPLTRGFDRFFGFPESGGIYFWPPHSNRSGTQLIQENESIDPDDPNWYSTTAFTDYAIGAVEEAVSDEVPFFMYVAYIAPHFPLQAPDEDIQRYVGKYSEGYDAIRQARFAKQKALGILPEDAVMSPTEGDWSGVSDKEYADLKMAIYAAQMDIMDQNIGRLIASLKEQGAYDNTIIFFLSDNGGASASQNSNTSEVGTAASFVSYGKSWANVSNTPYRDYKSKVHEGGIISPLIVHWPEGLSQTGTLNRELSHITDIMPTVLDITGTEYPTAYNGHNIIPIEGKSLIPLLNGEPADPERIIGWEHEGNQGVRLGDWKLVKKHNNPWELYDLSIDPTELNDLSNSEPEILDMLVEHYRQFTIRTDVVQWPVENPADYEFENFTVIENTIDIAYIKDNDDASNDAFYRLEPTGEGDEHIKFNTTVTVAGMYYLKVRHKVSSKAGIYNLYINDQLVGSNVDQYHATSTSLTNVELGYFYIEDGDVNVTVELVGKNEASSSYELKMDKLLLEYVPGFDEDNMEYEFEGMDYSNATFEEVTTRSVSGASGGALHKLAADGVGREISYRFPVSKSQTYIMKIQHWGSPTRGIYTVMVNGEKLAGEFDQYAPEQAPIEYIIDTLYLEAGEVDLRLEVIGQRSESEAYNLQMDKLTLEAYDTEALASRSATEMESTNEALTLYPNPASATITLKNVEAEKVELLPVTLNGAIGGGKLYTVTDIAGNSFDVSGLPDGMYIARIYTESGYEQRVIWIKR